MIPLHVMFLLAAPLFAAPAPAPTQPQLTTEQVRQASEKAFKDLADEEDRLQGAEPAEAAPPPAPAPAPEPAPVEVAPPPAKAAPRPAKPAPAKDDTVDCGDGNIALKKPAQMSTTGYGGTAEAGVDGVKNGSYGPHSNGSDAAWWQVDLGKDCRLGRVVVYNRQGYEDRADSLMILTTRDEKPTEATKWKKLASHLGEDRFGGVYDEKPWVVEAKGESARWIRVQLGAVTYMNLDEIEVFGPATAKP